MKNHRSFHMGAFAVAAALAYILCQPKATGVSRRPSVESILSAGFHRVAGGGSQGTSFDTGGPGSWYASSAGMPTVVHDGKLYRMWFVGSAPAVHDAKMPYGETNAIGLATSADGLQWVLANKGKPVFESGPPGSFDCKGVSHQYVMRIGRKYWMWYVGCDGSSAGDLGLTPASVRVERIGLATSSDGIRWKRGNSGKPVLDIGGRGTIDSIQVDSPAILRIGGRFVMWYGGYNGHHSLGMAESADGIHWTKLNGGRSLQVLTGREQLGPSVYFDGKQYLLLYQDNRGRGDEGASWNTYAATSEDGVQWRSMLGGRPVLGPPQPGGFDSAGRGRNYAVHPSQVIIVGRSARVWYMGEDGSPPHYQRIGLMEAVLTK